jgi:capsule polysaccharide export protein KpsE/RkpR
MRKPNVEIKKVNLAKAEIQFNAYQAQLVTLETKVEEVRAKLLAKNEAVQALKAEIKALETQATNS